jgi:hypothetical protein
MPQAVDCRRARQYNARHNNSQFGASAYTSSKTRNSGIEPQSRLGRSAYRGHPIGMQRFRLVRVDLSKLNHVNRRGTVITEPYEMIFKFNQCGHRQNDTHRRSSILTYTTHFQLCIEY